ncbi:MAG: PAS domain S-box protein [Xanthobacteraceae bacterium]
MTVFGKEPWEALRFLRRPMPLRVALAAMALGVLLPSIIFFILQYRTAMGDKKSDMRSFGALLASAIGDDILREVAIKRAQLSTLATSPDLRTDDLSTFYEQAKQAAQSVPGLITLLTADGQRLFSTQEPPESLTGPAPNLSLIREVSRSGYCATTNLYQPAQSGRLTVSLLCPAKGTSYVLAGNLPPDYLCGVVRSQTPVGWLATLVDGDGHVVARSDCAISVVNMQVSPMARARMAGAANGWMGISLDGSEAYGAWHHLANGWTVLAAVPRETMEGPMRRWRTKILWSLLIFSGLAFVAAALVGEWVIRSIKSLSRAAAEIGTGRTVEPSGSSIAEVREVSAALAQASQDRARSEIANAHLAALVTYSGDAIMSVSLDGYILSWNSAAEQLYGYTAAEAIGRQQADLVPAHRLNELDEKLAAARDDRSLRLETVRRRKDGSLIEVSLDAGPIRNSDGELVGISVIAHDITKRKRNEEHMEFVMRELSHRTKNLITVIIAMARRTARQSGDFSDFEEKFTGRLHGLARSHDLLVQTDWMGASVDELVRSQLSPFITDPASLQTNGPDLLLRPEAVQNLGFALHELATNANKFGALCQPGGQIEFSWEIIANGNGEPRIRMRWCESGGPEVVQPTRSGFGSTVIQKLTEASLNATVTTTFERQGFCWVVDMPANEILSEGDIAVSGLLATAAAMQRLH